MVVWKSLLRHSEERFAARRGCAPPQEFVVESGASSRSCQLQLMVASGGQFTHRCSSSPHHGSSWSSREDDHCARKTFVKASALRGFINTALERQFVIVQEEARHNVKTGSLLPRQEGAHQGAGTLASAGGFPVVASGTNS